MADSTDIGQASDVDFSAVAAKMDAVIGSLRQQLALGLAESAISVSAETSLGQWLLGNEASQSAASKNLETDSGYIDQLDGVLRARVLLGNYTPEQWRQQAKTVADDIETNTTIGYAGTYLDGFWNDVVRQSASDLVDDAKAAYDLAKNAVPSWWQINFVLAVAVILGGFWVFSKVE